MINSFQSLDRNLFSLKFTVSNVKIIQSNYYGSSFNNYYGSSFNSGTPVRSKNITSRSIFRKYAFVFYEEFGFYNRSIGLASGYRGDS